MTRRNPLIPLVPSPVDPDPAAVLEQLQELPPAALCQLERAKATERNRPAVEAARAALAASAQLFMAEQATRARGKGGRPRKDPSAPKAKPKKTGKKLGRKRVLKPHGTRNRYMQGCHCAKCRKATADYQRAYAHRIKNERMSA